MKLDEVIGKRVAYLRNRLGLTGDAFAERMNSETGTRWNRQTVWEAERGARGFRTSELIALATVGKVPITFFLQPPRPVAEVEVMDKAIAAHDLLDLFRL